MFDIIRTIFVSGLFFAFVFAFFYYLRKFCMWIREGEDARLMEEQRYRDNIERIARSLEKQNHGR